MRVSKGGPLAGLLLLGVLAAQGCGGGGGGGAAGGDRPTERRGFEFTVAVPGVSGALGAPRFFGDEALTDSRIDVRSSSGALVTQVGVLSGSVSQQVVSAMPSEFGLAIHFDASLSMKDQDPSDARFTAATNLVSGVGSAPRGAPRYFTFRHNPSNSADSEYNTPRFKAVSSTGEASGEGERGNSPAISATYNIIGTGNGANGSLTGNNHAMLLLTDGDNNAEDPALLPGCSGPEGSDPSQCGVPDVLVTRANARQVRVFVAGLGNDDDALQKFQRLARDTGAAFLKATQSSDLNRQFQNLGRLMVNGGVVVTAATQEFEITQGGNPFLRGWLQFNRINGSCPSPSQLHDANTCKIPF
jgi:hypothetical protein